MNDFKVLQPGTMVKVQVIMTKDKVYTARVTGQHENTIPSVHKNSITSVTVTDPGNTDKEIGSIWDVGTAMCTPLAKVGIITAGNIVAAFNCPDGQMSNHMLMTYMGFMGANLDTETLMVDADRWLTIKAALEDSEEDAEEPTDIQDFTTA